MTELITQPYTNQAMNKGGPSRYTSDRPGKLPQSQYGNYKGKRFNPNYKRPEGNNGEAKDEGKERKA